MRAAIRILGLLFVVSLMVFAPASAGTALSIVKGSGEFQSFEQSITVDVPQIITLQWVPNLPGAASGTYQVTNNKNATKVTGSMGAAPQPGHLTRVNIPATGAGSFLAAVPPGSPVTYTISVTATDSMSKPLGGPASVTVVQQTFGPQPPIVFGPNMVAPDIELVHYKEKVGIVPFTQIYYGTATVTVRAINHGTAATDPVTLSISDFNVLMRQTGGVHIDSLKKWESVEKTITLNAVLPPPESQTPQELQFSKWHAQYDGLCGVDLRAVMDWSGPQANAPMNDHVSQYLYLGYHDSQPWDEGPQPSDSLSCDDSNCVSIAQMNRSIYKQLACKVVGASWFVGRDLKHGKFGAFGEARTDANAPAAAYTPNTKMEVASVSKVVTMLTAVNSLAAHGIALNTPMWSKLPTDWQTLLDPAVKKITYQQLLSQSSGIKNYGNFGNDYAGLKTFFTQAVNPNGSATCKGAGVQNVTDPINPNNTSPCYSNFNFAIFRLLIPKIEGFKEDNNLITRPQTLADQYVQTAQKYVFNPVGQAGVDCKPPAGSTTYSFVYKFPPGQTGFDWKDTTLGCGAAAWYLSATDIAKVLVSLNKGDGMVLSKSQFNSSDTLHLGWDKTKSDDFDLGTTAHSGYRELEKNGGWSACAKVDPNNNQNCLDPVGLGTAIDVLGGSKTAPGVVGVVFINSAPGPSATGVIEQAYNSNVKPKP